MIEIQRNSDAEVSLLMGLMYSDIGDMTYIDRLTDFDFSIAVHKEMFRVIEKNIKAGVLVDEVILLQELPQYREQLLDIFRNVIGKNKDIYFKIVKEKSVERKMQLVLSEALRAIEMNIDHNDKIDKVMKIISDIDTSTNDISNQVIKLDTFLKDVVEELSKIYEGDETESIKTGYADIDNVTGGIKKGDLITLGARTSVGKSTLGLNIGENIAKQGKKVLYVTMEMTGKALAKRNMCSIGRIASDKLKTKEGLDTTWSAITSSIGKLMTLDIHVVKMARPTVEEIKSTARAFMRKNGFDILIIDHLHLMSHDKSGSEAQGIGNSTAELKGLALELDIPVLLMAQLNRDSAKDDNRKPRITDLRGSGAIEQDSDGVWLLHRNEELDDAGVSILVIAKNRDGETGANIELINSLAYFRFDNKSHANYPDDEAGY